MEEEEGERGQSGPLGAVSLSMKESRGPPHLSQRGTKLYSRPNTMQTNTLPFTAVILYHDHGERRSLIGQFERSWTHPRRVFFDSVLYSIVILLMLFGPK